MKSLAAIAFASVVLSAGAQEVLTNDSVIRMVRAGLSSDIVLTKINGSAAQFDTSSDALIALKTAGVSDEVIRAMLAKPASKPVAAPAPASTESLCTSVTYYTNGSNGWSWVPASICTGANGVSIDEEVVPFSDWQAYCEMKAVAPPFGDNQRQWWIATTKQTYKVRSESDDLHKLAEAAGRRATSIKHGDCGSRSLRKLFR